MKYRKLNNNCFRDLGYSGVIDTLRLLSEKEKLKFTEIQFTVQMQGSTITNCINILKKYCLIEKNNEKLYVLTDKGKSVYKNIVDLEGAING